MTPVLVVAATVVAVVVVVLGLASSAAGRRIGVLHLAGAGLLEALLVVQAVLAFARMEDGTPADTPTFLGYLFGVLLIPVAGVLWAQAERTRWAGTVLAVAAAAVAVMLWRLLQLWEATGA
ncbi:hypothetical protein ACI799_13540 [Blastococcus sp. SYSU DS0753]